MHSVSNTTKNKNEALVETKKKKKIERVTYLFKNDNKKKHRVQKKYLFFLCSKSNKIKKYTDSLGFWDDLAIGLNGKANVIEWIILVDGMRTFCNDCLFHTNLIGIFIRCVK